MGAEKFRHKSAACRFIFSPLYRFIPSAFPPAPTSVKADTFSASTRPESEHDVNVSWRLLAMWGLRGLILMVAGVSVVGVASGLVTIASESILLFVACAGLCILCLMADHGLVRRMARMRPLASDARDACEDAPSSFLEYGEAELTQEAVLGRWPAYRAYRFSHANPPTVQQFERAVYRGIPVQRGESSVSLEQKLEAVERPRSRQPAPAPAEISVLYEYVCEQSLLGAWLKALQSGFSSLFRNNCAADDSPPSSAQPQQDTARKGSLDVDEEWLRKIWGLDSIKRQSGRYLNRLTQRWIVGRKSSRQQPAQPPKR